MSKLLVLLYRLNVISGNHFKINSKMKTILSLFLLLLLWGSFSSFKNESACLKVNCSIENGNFSTSTAKDTQQAESGDEAEKEESTFTFWLLRGGLITVFLVIISVGLLKLRGIRKALP